ncbi:hypothetical protein BLNAU_226 [Blattamonas nauphoetae]|uniref:Uncharacterized protein n=1 Tax=Blattamonas nauphoetae TaxID=2049346 RepID=A0ABQ9YMQ1_9EUKA|nr:hypothetical protein BLNAU_226 [Blattamonas nauphoetae]
MELSSLITIIGKTFNEPQSVQLETAFIDCTFKSCTNTENGGCVSVVQATKVLFKGCTFSDSKSSKQGGALYFHNSIDGLNLDTCNFFNCSSTSHGGCVSLCLLLDVVITGTTAKNCSSSEAGGFVYSHNNPLNVSFLYCCDCTSAKEGAALSMNGSFSAQILHSLFVAERLSLDTCLILVPFYQQWTATSCIFHVQQPTHNGTDVIMETSRYGNVKTSLQDVVSLTPTVEGMMKIYDRLTKENNFDQFYTHILTVEVDPKGIDEPICFTKKCGTIEYVFAEFRTDTLFINLQHDLVCETTLIPTCMLDLQIFCTNIPLYVLIRQDTVTNGFLSVTTDVDVRIEHCTFSLRFDFTPQDANFESCFSNINTQSKGAIFLDYSDLAATTKPIIEFKHVLFHTNSAADQKANDVWTDIADAELNPLFQHCVSTSDLPRIFNSRTGDDRDNITRILNVTYLEFDGLDNQFCGVQEKACRSFTFVVSIATRQMEMTELHCRGIFNESTIHTMDKRITIDDEQNSTIIQYYTEPQISLFLVTTGELNVAGLILRQMNTKQLSPIAILDGNGVFRMTRSSIAEITRITHPSGSLFNFEKGHAVVSSFQTPTSANQLQVTSSFFSVHAASFELSKTTIIRVQTTDSEEEKPAGLLSTVLEKDSKNTIVDCVFSTISSNRMDGIVIHATVLENAHISFARVTFSECDFSGENDVRSNTFWLWISTSKSASLSQESVQRFEEGNMEMKDNTDTLGFSFQSIQFIKKRNTTEKMIKINSTSFPKDETRECLNFSFLNLTWSDVQHAGPAEEDNSLFSLFISVPTHLSVSPAGTDGVECGFTKGNPCKTLDFLHSTYKFTDATRSVSITTTAVFSQTIKVTHPLDMTSDSSWLLDAKTNFVGSTCFHVQSKLFLKSAMVMGINDPNTEIKSFFHFENSHSSTIEQLTLNFQQSAAVTQTCFRIERSEINFISLKLNLPTNKLKSPFSIVESSIEIRSFKIESSDTCDGMTDSIVRLDDTSSRLEISQLVYERSKTNISTLVFPRFNNIYLNGFTVTGHTQNEHALMTSTVLDQSRLDISNLAVKTSTLGSDSNFMKVIVETGGLFIFQESTIEYTGRVPPSATLLHFTVPDSYQSLHVERLKVSFSEPHSQKGAAMRIVTDNINQLMLYEPLNLTFMPIRWDDMIGSNKTDPQNGVSLWTYLFLPPLQPTVCSESVDGVGCGTIHSPCKTMDFVLFSYPLNHKELTFIVHISSELSESCAVLFNSLTIQTDSNSKLTVTPQTNPSFQAKSLLVRNISLSIRSENCHFPIFVVPSKGQAVFDTTSIETSTDIKTGTLLEAVSSIVILKDFVEGTSKGLHTNLLNLTECELIYNKSSAGSPDSVQTTTRLSGDTQLTLIHYRLTSTSMSERLFSFTQQSGRSNISSCQFNDINTPIDGALITATIANSSILVEKSNFFKIQSAEGLFGGIVSITLLEKGKLELNTLSFNGECKGSGKGSVFGIQAPKGDFIVRSLSFLENFPFPDEHHKHTLNKEQSPFHVHKPNFEYQQSDTEVDLSKSNFSSSGNLVYVIAPNLLSTAGTHFKRISMRTPNVIKGFDTTLEKEFDVVYSIKRSNLRMFLRILVILVIAAVTVPIILFLPSFLMICCCRHNSCCRLMKTPCCCMCRILLPDAGKGMLEEDDSASAAILNPRTALYQQYSATEQDYGRAGIASMVGPSDVKKKADAYLKDLESRKPTRSINEENFLDVDEDDEEFI